MIGKMTFDVLRSSNSRRYESCSRITDIKKYAPFHSHGDLGVPQYPRKKKGSVPARFENSKKEKELIDEVVMSKEIDHIVCM